MPAARSKAPTRSPLLDKLTARIAQEGPLSIEDYMAACLADPEHGYYVTRDPFGAAGDFTTAPEISQVFGELIGMWCAVAWQQMGEPNPVRLIELGPGRGTLMADMLRATRQVPGFREAIEVHLVETSPVLRGVQMDKLSTDVEITQWHDNLADVPPGAAIIIANEFLDALPVRHFKMKNGEWFERCVGLSNDGTLKFCLSDTPAGDTSVIPETIRNMAREGDMAEAGLAAGEIVASVASRAAQAPTIALFIDYGHVKTGVGETLQAVKGHDYADPLESPGEADLTAHVDFEALGHTARANGFDVHGPMRQGAFLMSLGLKERVESLVNGVSDENAREILSGAHRLADASQMGDLFKVMALSSRGVEVPPFDSGQPENA